MLPCQWRLEEGWRGSAKLFFEALASLTFALLQALELENVRTHHWHVLQCSAMTGRNLKEGLAWVVEDAKKRLFLY
jgi:hypothetical protein